MKKLFVLLLAMILVFALVSCGETETSEPNKDNPATSQNGSERNGGEVNNGGSSIVDAMTQAQMEAEILRRLSGISELESLTLCGGSEIEYMEDGIFFAGDSWTVTSPDKSSDDLYASLDSQLSAVGFEKDLTLFGCDYTVKAGVNSIGISIFYDTEGGEVIFRMTNHRDEYNQAYIDAENAKLPTIIEGLSALDKLPENFSITYLSFSGTDRTTICRYNGGYYVETEALDDEDSDYHFVFYYAAVPNGTGGFDYYKWTDTTKRWDGSVEYEQPKLAEYFISKDTQPEKYVASCLGYGTYSDKGTASTWLKMCFDYKGLTLPEELAENSFYDEACVAFSISENMTKVGTTTLLGRNCETVHSEGLWSTTYDLTFDLETGITMKLVAQEPSNGEFVSETYFEVTELDLNPTSLGKFEKPAD